MAGRFEIGISVTPDQVPAIAAGYDFLEFPVMASLAPLDEDAAFAARSAALAALRPQVRAFNAFVPRHVRLTGENVDWPLVETYVERAFRRAAELGGKLIGFGSGAARSVPEGFSHALAWGQLVRFLNLCADQAARHGIAVTIEPVHSGESNILTTYPEAVQMARDVARDEVGITADIFHFMQDGEPLDDIVTGPEYLAHVHLADTGRRYPGSGAYPLERLFAILREIDYAGAVSIECNWGADLGEESARSLRFLRTLLP